MSSNPVVPVSIFNANTTSVNVTVNNGTQFTVDGAKAPTFSPAFNNSACSFATNPSGNTFGVTGTNFVDITPVGSNQPIQFQINISSSIQVTSLQLYMFWASQTTAGWVLLNNGQIIAMDTLSGGGSSSSPSSSRTTAKRY